MRREWSKEGASPTDGGDGSALPSSASWATRGVQQQSRTTSHPASTATPSPKVDTATLVAQTQEESLDTTAVPPMQPEQLSTKQPLLPLPDSSHLITHASSQSQESRDRPPTALLDGLLKAVASPHFRFTLGKEKFTPEEYAALMRHPLLIDPSGGAKLRARREAEAQRKREEALQSSSHAGITAKPEDALASGSLQLGGEPEGRQNKRESNARILQGDLNVQDQQHQPIHPPSQLPVSGVTAQDAPFGPSYATVNASTNLANTDRGLTITEPSQQQHLPSKSGNPQLGSFFEHSPHPFNQHQQPHSEHFQQAQNLALQGHARQTSRFTFANDPNSASGPLKTGESVKIMAQQAAMMPNTTGNHPLAPQNHQQYAGNQFYGATMPVPPPGLKSTGATPVSGGGLFSHGQGFGNPFTTSNRTNNLANVDSKPELLREMIHNRGSMASTGGGHGLDTGKRESMFSLLQQFHPGSTPFFTPGLSSTPFGPQLGAHHEYGSQKQKRKGKKHRQANASSTGGGGIVDLADPSVLHARLQHQAGTGLGQGLYSGHGQGGFNPAGAAYGGGINRW